MQLNSTIADAAAKLSEQAAGVSAEAAKVAKELGATDYIRKTDDLDKTLAHIKENLRK